MLSLLESTRTPCAVLSASHTLLWMNQAYEDLAGYAAVPSLLGATVSDPTPQRRVLIEAHGERFTAHLLWLAGLAEGSYLLTLHPAMADAEAAPAANSAFVNPVAFNQQIDHLAEAGTPFALLHVGLTGLLDHEPTAREDLALRTAMHALLRKQTRSEDILCEFAAGDYGVLLPQCTFASVLQRISQGLMTNLSTLGMALPKDRLVVPLRLDVGAALFPHHGHEAAQVIHAAEGALALAQTAPRGDFYLFEPADQAA